MSELIPHMGTVADDVCVIKSMHTETINHDPATTYIMTGSQMDGTAFPGNMNLTCANYTSSNFGKVEVGHVDRTGLTDTPFAHSWNSSHQSRDCSQDGLISTGGNALFYCFAAQ
jgi:hypothetical protein